MREIKFRAWNGTAMYKPILDGETVYRDWRDLEDGISCQDELMQYTGLKDKNGVEIYEGDIVEILLMKNKHIGKIMYNDKMACFEVYVKHIDGRVNGYIIGHIHSIKAIGNIYENPELLQN